MAIPIEIDIWQGEISELEVDAIVVPANESLFMTSALASAVKRRAGDRVERAAVEQGPIRAGEAVLTDGGNLAAPYLIHAVSVGHELRADTAVLERALRNAFDLADQVAARRIAMPALGTERGIFEPAAAAGALGRVLQARAGRGSLTSIVITVATPDAGAALHAVLDPLRAEAR